MSVKQSLVGNGKVYLIAGGGKIYTDIAARFVRSERPVAEIIESPYSPGLIHNILNAGHKAALEFDYFIFGVEGYSRVCETQLVRKRHASYLIKSGRAELGGKRQYSVVLPESLSEVRLPVMLPNGVPCKASAKDLCKMLEDYYDAGRLYGLPEEELRYMKPQATEFRAIIGMNCFDEKTEVLTNEGWKYFKDLNGSEEFYSMEPETGIVEYVKAVKYIKQHYVGDMIHVKSRRLDLLTTPNHNNLAFLGSKPDFFSVKKGFTLIRASDMDSYQNVKFTRTCEEVVGEHMEYISLPEINNKKCHHNGKVYPTAKLKIQLFLKLLGFYLSDGSVFKKEGKSGACKYTITFAKGNLRTLEKYKGIIKEMFGITAHIYDNKHGCYKLQFMQPQLGKYFSDLGTAIDKYIPDELFRLSKENLECLLEGMCDGDVSKNSKSGKVSAYYTSSKHLADGFQRLLLHCGKSGQIKTYFSQKISTGKDSSGINYSIQRKHPAYVISFTLEEHHLEMVKDYNWSNIFNITNFKGYVYCVELEKFHTLYVRRNGKPVWSGNCHALLDFFAVRCCRNAQTEIRDLATKMMKLCKRAAPDIFASAGPNCVQLGYCPENKMQNKSCKGRILTKAEALEIIKNVRGHNYDCPDVISD